MISEHAILDQHDHPEATVVRIRGRKFPPDDVSAPIKEVLIRLADTGSSRIILDFSEVEWISSIAVGWLLIIRKKLQLRGKYFQPPCRRRGLFAMFRDELEALEAIRNGESDPLLLCGVSPAAREVFAICGSQELLGDNGLPAPAGGSPTSDLSGSVADAFGTAVQLRTGDEILGQVRAERDAWGNR